MPLWWGGLDFNQQEGVPPTFGASYAPAFIIFATAPYLKADKIHNRYFSSTVKLHCRPPRATLAGVEPASFDFQSNEVTVMCNSAIGKEDKIYNAREPFSLDRVESNHARKKFMACEVCVICNSPFGDLSRTRTCNPLIKNQMIYQLNYQIITNG